MGLRVPLAGAGRGCAVGKCRAHPGPAAGGLPLLDEAGTVTGSGGQAGGGQGAGSPHP